MWYAVLNNYATIHCLTNSKLTRFMIILDSVYVNIEIVHFHVPLTSANPCGLL